jgi:hypothetical protein
MPERTPWPPRLPKRFPLTLRGNEYVKKHEGRLYYVAGKVPPSVALARWDEMRAKMADRLPATDTLAVGPLANLYLAWLRKRTEGAKGHKPLSARSYSTAARVLIRFSKAVGRNTPVDAVGPSQFSAFSEALPGESASTRTPYVVYVRGMFRWGVDSGHIEREPRYGREFARPRMADLMASRGRKRKAYSPEELRECLEQCRRDPMRLAWLTLGINCAFHNADIATLTRDVVKLDGPRPVIDFRRGKTTIGRVAPLMPATVAALKAYKRPAPIDPAHDGLFFLSSTGRPLIRDLPQEGIIGDTVHVDEVGKYWVRQWPKLEPGRGNTRRKGSKPFSGLRTTFGTVATRLSKTVADDLAADIVMGHASATGTTRRRWYVEEVNVEAVAEFVARVWAEAWGQQI